MTRHMFISMPHRWFSRLALLLSFAVLSGICIESYTQLFSIDTPLKTWNTSFQSYLIKGTGIIILFLTASSIYLHRELSAKPFFICLGLLMLITSQYFEMNTTFIQTLVNLLILSFLWWLSIITGPRNAIIMNENDKKYRPWAWLGLLLLFSQLLFNTWLTASHAKLACADFHECYDQLLTLPNFHALTSLPLNQDGLVTLNILYRLGMLFTTVYLTIFSVCFIFNRALGEVGILLSFFMLPQIILGVLGWTSQTVFWISLGQQIVSALLLLTIISLLITLYRSYRISYY